MPIERDLPESEYHARPALSATGAWELASECPAIYWHTSPFNPAAATPTPSKEMDIGTALHLAVLEPDRLAKTIEVVPAADWRTKAAQQARDEARAAGRLPLLTADRVRVARLSAALRENRWIEHLLANAETEVSYFWDEVVHGIPCKARADIASVDGEIIGDLKVSSSAAPEFFRRRAFQAGHFLRAPWYMDGFEVATGIKPRAYWFVVIAREEPHLVTVCQLDDRAMQWGRLMIRRAVNLFHACSAAGRWPGYEPAPVTLSLPTWAEYGLADREQAGDFDSRAYCVEA